MKYRKEIDGLRALAILPVVFYHAGLPAFSGGFVGVDVFFVISGYLIASIILTEKREGRFSFISFYARRVRRIFPALFVMMLVSYPTAWLLLDPAAMKEFSGSIAASMLFVANVYFLDLSGYFATAAELKPLLHNWSLSVEEQFYLIFPAVVIFGWRAGATLQAALFAAIAVASLALAQWQVTHDDAARAFFLLQTRIWELMIGVLAAYWLDSDHGQNLQRSGRLRHAALIGLAMILAAVFTYNGETPFPGITALLPCLGALLVVAFATPQNLTGILLGWRPMVFVGLISYSLYLWHFPILAFTRIATGTGNDWLLLAACGLAFLAACASWRYVERPVRELHAMPALKLFGTAAAAMALLWVLGETGSATEGYRSVYLQYRLDDATRANYEKFKPQTQITAPPDEDCWFTSRKPDKSFETSFRDCTRRYEKALLVLGDSHAGNIYPALRYTGNERFLVALWRGGCRPFKPMPECAYEDVIPFLERHKTSVAQVVFHVSGSHYIVDHVGKEDSKYAFLPGSRSQIATENIRKTVEYLKKLPKGMDIVWLGPFAEARVDLDNPQSFSPDRLRFNTVSLKLFNQLDQAIKSELKNSGVRYVSLVDALEFNEDTLVQGDCLTFRDIDHFSHCGEKLYGPAISAALAAPERGPAN